MFCIHRSTKVHHKCKREAPSYGSGENENETKGVAKKRGNETKGGENERMSVKTNSEGGETDRISVKKKQGPKVANRFLHSRCI